MAKVSFTNLKIKNIEKYKTCNFNENEIDILQYLSIEDKYNMVNIVLQESYENGVFHPVKIEALFYTYLVIMYTNIHFTDKQKENIYKLYDNIKAIGLLDFVIKNIEEQEFNDLLSLFEQTLEEKNKYQLSLAGMLNSISSILATKVENFQNQLTNIDFEKISNVITLANQIK